MAGRRERVRRAGARARAAESGGIATTAIRVDEKIDGRRARGERSRAAVLERAVAIASTEGLESLTLGRLAAEAGVGKSNLTVLFGDRQSLQLATLDAAIATLTATVITPALALADPEARLRALCDGWFKYVKTETFPGGCFMYATAHEFRGRPGPIRDRVVSELSGWKRLLGSTIKAGIAAGAFRANVNVRDAVSALCAYQDTAHLARLLEDAAGTASAARLTRNLIDSLEASSRGHADR